MLRRLFLLLLLAGLAVRPACATPVFTWSFNPATYSDAGPNFTVDFTATIMNTGTTAIGSVDREVVTYFSNDVTNVVFGNLPISAGSPLASGQSLNFDFVNFTFAGIPPGTYMPIISAYLILDDATGARTQVFVSDVPTLVVSPEPSALLLMATGVVGLLATVRRKA